MISQNYTITLPYPLVTPHTSENIRAYTLKTENKRFCAYGYYTAPTIPQNNR